MALKDILVSVDPTSAGEARLRLAFNLARVNKAHLGAIHPLPGPEAAGPASAVGYGPAAPGMMVGGQTPGGAVMEMTRAADRAETAERLFKHELRVNSIEGDWHFVDDSDGEELIDLAKSADMTILGQVAREGRVAGAARFRPDDIMLAIGRPVLVVPYAGTFETVGRRVLIAWDGTREAIRAMNDALPLYSGAEMVTLMHVAPQPAALDRTRPALERAACHLQHHGIGATAEETLKGDIAISDVLLSRAADFDADLIVAGGYHHSPLREAVLGGVSRELLAHMTVPVLMSH
jgi:nucleotide-binding universal stress UspA family protein